MKTSCCQKEEVSSHLTKILASYARPESTKRMQIIAKNVATKKGFAQSVEYKC
jgi:hypothetical protein